MEKIRLLLYCTKSKPYLYREDDDFFKLENEQLNEDISDYTKYYGLNNGKIVAECDFEVEKIREAGDEDEEAYYYTENLLESELLRQSCLKYGKLANYLLFSDNAYVIHIKNLNIFDKPKELNKCMSIKTFENEFVSKTLSPEMISKAPQNMMKVKMWVDGKEYGMWKNYVLISIRPEWLCKILNGEKTIEIRKKVLKEMVENES